LSSGIEEKTKKIEHSQSGEKERETAKLKQENIKYILLKGGFSETSNVRTQTVPCISLVK